MLVFKVSDLLSRLDELKADGFEYVDLSLSSEDNVPFINFEGITGENSGIDYEDVEAVTLPELYYLDK